MNRNEDGESITAFINMEVIYNVRKSSLDEGDELNAWLKWIQEKMGKEKLEKTNVQFFFNILYRKILVQWW